MEIWKAIQSLDPDSAPGPDGFTGAFFVNCWDIVKDDVVAAVQSFFQGDPIPKAYTSTILDIGVLIPNLSNPSSFSDLRPISLCSFSYQILSS